MPRKASICPPINALQAGQLGEAMESSTRRAVSDPQAGDFEPSGPQCIMPPMMNALLQERGKAVKDG